jgi:SspJ family small acid-soluble spore protein
MSITIRKGAAYNDITIEEKGKTSYFDLSTMDKADRAKTRRVIVGALTHAGVLKDQGGKFAVGKKANSRRRRPAQKRRAAR